MDLGLERAGFEVLSQCEIEDFRRAILARHWPEVERHDDVRSVSYPAGSAELLFGGFPCQGLSVAGRRKGLEDPRSGLFFEFARVADESVPPGGWILIENVPGLFSSPGRDKETGVDATGRDFAIVLSTLADLGFRDIAWRVLDSRYFGVPQRRRRVFILARRSDGQRAAEVLLEPEGDGGHPQEGRKKKQKRPIASARGAGDGVGGALAEGGGGSSDKDVRAFNITPGGHRVPGGFGPFRDAPMAINETDVSSTLDSVAGSTKIVGGVTKRYGKGTDSDATDALIPVGIGGDLDVSGTLCASRGKDGGGMGLEKEGALAIAFNWQSGGDVRLGVVENEVPTLQKQQVPAVQAVGVLGSEAHTLTSEGMDASEDGTGRGTPVVHVLVAPEVAAPLTRGHATGEGVSVPGRRKEDDVNLVVFNARHLDPQDESPTLTGGERNGGSYSLNNMPLVAKCLTATPGRWDYETEDFLVHAESESPTLREHVRNNSNPATEEKMHIMVRPQAVPGAKAVSENQRAETRLTDATYSITSGGGKPGQGYPAAQAGGMVRRLTPTECERLQGFPDGWTILEDGSLAGEPSWYEVRLVQAPDGATVVVPRSSDVGYLDRLLASLLGAHDVEEPKPDGRRYAACGDAVTVPVAHWIGSRLLRYGVA